jgi:hypothetical protein
MGKDDSQFTAPNHIDTGQNKSVSTNGHEDPSFIEFREHALEIVRKSRTPIADAFSCIGIFYCFTKTITLRVRCQQRFNRGDEPKLTRQEASCFTTSLTSSTERK